MAGVGGDAQGLVRPVEHRVREPMVLTTEHDRDVAVDRSLEKGRRRLRRLGPLLLRHSPPRRRRRDPHDVGYRRVETVEDLDTLDDVFGVVGDSVDAAFVELGGRHEAEARELHVLHRPYRQGDVHQVLGLVQNEHDVLERGAALRHRQLSSRSASYSGEPLNPFPLRGRRAG